MAPQVRRIKDRVRHRGDSGLAIAVLCAVQFGCSASQRPGNSASAAALPPPETRATLVGPLCTGASQCRCRGVGLDVGQPAPGLKRFEIQIGPIPNQLWVSVGQAVLYKNNERAQECYYLDLPPGHHPVRVQGSGDPTFAAAVQIRELAPARKGARQAFYDSFRFSCGAPGPCSIQHLRDFRRELKNYHRGIFDPCGSTKVRGMVWQTGRLPDRLHPDSLRLEFVLDVYRFTPDHPPGHPACAKKMN